MKTATVEVKLADAEQGIVSGYASTFGGEPDSYGDIVQPGAFKATLAAHKAAGTAPLMLWNHDPGEVPIGTWTEVREDANGLFVVGQLNLEIEKARTVLSALKAKSTAGLSIGFRTPKGGRVSGTKAGTYLLKQVDLVEISLVNIPANVRARIVSAKSQNTTADRIAKAAAEIRKYA